MRKEVGHAVTAACPTAQPYTYAPLSKASCPSTCVLRAANRRLHRGTNRGDTRATVRRDTARPLRRAQLTTHHRRPAAPTLGGPRRKLLQLRVRDARFQLLLHALQRFVRRQAAIGQAA